MTQRAAEMRRSSGDDFAEVFGARRNTISDGGRATACPNAQHESQDRVI